MRKFEFYYIVLSGNFFMTLDSVKIICIGSDLMQDDFKPIETMEGDDLAWLIDQLTGRLTQSTHPNLKQAGCLWLLAVTRHCNGQPAVSGQLLRIQSAFMSLLGDGNDLIQDAASKGTKQSRC